MATYQACQVIGMPECRINLAHLVSYLSEAPKSTRAYEGYRRAEEAAKLSDSALMGKSHQCRSLGVCRGHALGFVCRVRMLRET